MIKTNTQNIRLHKYLSEKGFGSRRSIEKLISNKKIFVNNEIAILGQKVSIGDKIKIQQSTIVVDDSSKVHHQHLIYNKPEGEICSRNDPDARKTTFSALPRLNNLRWISIGRLDINTSGLLLFTTDGTIANRWMHPSNGYEREYMVRTYGKFKSNIEKSMINGTNLSDGMAKFKNITPIQDANNNKWFRGVWNKMKRDGEIEESDNKKIQYIKDNWVDNFFESNYLEIDRRLNGSKKKK